MPCRLAGRYQQHFWCEDEDGMFLQNGGIYLHPHIALLPKETTFVLIDERNRHGWKGGWMGLAVISVSVGSNMIFIRKIKQLCYVCGVPGENVIYW